MRSDVDILLQALKGVQEYHGSLEGAAYYLKVEEVERFEDLFDEVW